MSVRVLFFASLRDALGCDEHTLKVDAPMELSVFIDRLSSELGPAAREALTAESVRIAVNQELLNGSLFSREGSLSSREGSTLIRDADEVAFLPPVTGG